MFEAELSCAIDNSCAIQIRGYLFLLPSYTSVKKEKRNKKKKKKKKKLPKLFTHDISQNQRGSSKFFVVAFFLCFHYT